MDSFTSNGFSTSAASALLRPTSKSSFAVSESVDHAGTRLPADDATSPVSCSTGPDLSVTSHSEVPPTVVGLRQPADTCPRPAADTATTTDGRARLLSSRQRLAWAEMHERMDRRRREWNAEVDHIRTDFFKLKPPSASSTGDASQSSTVVTADRRQQRVVHVQPFWSPTTITRQQFQVSNNTRAQRRAFLLASVPYCSSLSVSLSVACLLTLISFCRSRASVFTLQKNRYTCRYFTDILAAKGRINQSINQSFYFRQRGP